MQSRGDKKVLDALNHSIRQNFFLLFSFILFDTIKYGKRNAQRDRERFYCTWKPYWRFVGYQFSFWGRAQSTDRINGFSSRVRYGQFLYIRRFSY